MTRVRTSLAAAAMTLTLALTGCGSESTSTDGQNLSAISVKDGDAKSGPTLSVGTTPFSVTETTSKVLKEGTGGVVTDKDLLTINAVIANGTSGATADSTYASGAVPIDLSDANLFPAMRKSLTGVKVGSRLLIAAPPADAFGDAGNEQLKFAKGDTVVFIIDVVSAVTPLKVAEGTAVAPKKGLPTVEMPAGKPAKITMPKGAKPPTTLVVQPLITGKGAKTKAGQTLRVDYTSALWKDGSVFDSSLNRPGEPFSFTLGQGQVIKGWDTGLTGLPVGSRVMLIIPPAVGYGAAGSPPKISGTDTLVFVVDILAAF